MARLTTADEVLSALMESLVNPVLAKVRPFGGARAAEKDISNQMEAVAWLYNHYLCQELPNLGALDWEEICNKATARQARLSKFMGFMGSGPLTLTEQKVKNACEAAKTLRASSNTSGSSFVTKVCVCLLNFRQDKCVLAFGATTMGMWSFIEKNKPLQSTKESSVGALLSDEECAFHAVEEQTGIKVNVLQLQGSYIINDDLNEAGGSTKFYIMLCSGTFDLAPKIKLERITWVSLDTVFSKARDPLIDPLVSTVRSTPAIQYYHLRPFCSSLDSWLTRQHEVKHVGQLTHALEDRAGTLLEKVGGITRVKLYKEVEDDEEQRKLLSVKVGAVGLQTNLSMDKSAQSTTGLNAKTDTLISSTGGKKEDHSAFVQKQEEDKQRHTNLEVHAIVLETQLSTGSPQSSTILRNRTVFSAGGSANDLAALSNRQLEDKARQVNEAGNALALSLNVEAPNGSPQSSTRMKKKEEEHIVDKAAAFLSLKTAYRSLRKRRKVLARELTEHTLQADALYKQIAGCDTNLVTLMGGGKAALQLAKEVCKNECEKQTSSSDVSIDCSQADALVQTDKVETSNKKRSFHMLKSSMQELDKVCTKNESPLPSYGVLMYTNDQGENVYRGKVRIRNADFELSETGEASDTAKNAKLSAAAYMLSTLHLLRARDGTI